MGILNTSVFVSPTGHVDGGSVWTSETLAYDGDVGTQAYTSMSALIDTWSNYLELTHSLILCDKVRLMATITGADTTTKDISIDIYYDAGWHNIYEGTLTETIWVAYPFTKQAITAMRVRFRRGGSGLSLANIYETQFWQFPVTIQVAWASNPFDASPIWTDISEFGIFYDIDRGRLYELDRFEAGTLTLLLKNMDNRFWSNNTGSPYYPNIDIGKQVRVQLTYNGVTYDRYTGYIEAFTPDWLSDEGGLVSVMRLDCADAIALFSRARLNHAGYAQQLPGARINSVLTNIGFPAAARALSNGVYSIPASGTVANEVAMQHIWDVSDAEIGLFYMTPSGNAKFEGHGDRPVDHPSAEFNCNNSMCDIDLSLDRKLLYTETRMTRNGGTEQVSTNATSNSNYGLSTLSRSGLLLTADSLAKEYGNLLLARYEKSAIRAKSLTFHLLSDADPWANCLARDISSRINVILTQANINADYYIEGMREHYDAREDKYTLEWQLMDAARYLYMPTSVEAILRPNGVGGSSALAPVGATYGWQCVNDVIINDSSYVQANAGGSRLDLYTRTNFETGGITNIHSVTLYGRMWASLLGVPPTVNGALSITVNSIIYSSTNVNLGAGGGVATSYNYQWTNSPGTNLEWTQSEINTMEIGILLVGANIGMNYGICSQLYAQVNYTPAW